MHWVVLETDKNEHLAHEYDYRSRVVSVNVLSGLYRALGVGYFYVVWRVFFWIYREKR